MSCTTTVHSSPAPDERQAMIKAMEARVAPEAWQRKLRSESVLSAEAVPINKLLPVIETAKEAKRRTKEEIAYRALALLVVAVKGEGLEQSAVDKIVKDRGLAQHFTPNERAFLMNATPSQHDKVQFVWRYEAAWTLLWALGYVDKLESPRAVCDVQRAVKLMREMGTKQFLAEARLRDLPEILDQADRIYRYHWAVVEARVNGRKAPAGLDPGVTMERHYALNWLIGYMEQEWDEISTDT